MSDNRVTIRLSESFLSEIDSEASYLYKTRHEFIKHCVQLELRRLSDEREYKYNSLAEKNETLLKYIQTLEERIENYQSHSIPSFSNSDSKKKKRR